MSQDFYSSLKLGDMGEKIFEEWMRSHVNVTDVSKLHHVNDFINKDYEYDYQVDTIDKSYAFEVKCLAGADGRGARYNNAVIEVWQDTKKTKRPGWFKATKAGKLDYVIFYNRFDSCLYAFKAPLLLKWTEHQQYLTYARNGNRDNPGWIVMLRWEEYGAGYLGKKQWR